MKIRYLYHSSFLIELDNDVLIFDYYKDKPRFGGAEDGVFNPQEWANKRVHVFVSHRHADHFNQVIFSWHYEVREMYYYLSTDVVPPKELDRLVTQLQPKKEYDVRGLHIHTFLSNDEGVAFLLEMENFTLFYAGDLNWWKWPGDKQSVQAEMESSYCVEIDLLKTMNVDVDLAFVPLDPRLEQNYGLAVDYFMRTIKPGALIPMHMDGKTDWIEKFKNEDCSQGYCEHIVQYEERGEVLKLPEDVEERLLTENEREILRRRQEDELDW